MAGHDIGNTRNAATEHVLGSNNVSTLTTAWSVTTTGNVTTTPIVSQGTVYFADSGGKFWAVNANSGQAIWSHSVSDYTGVTSDIVRDSPAVYGNQLVFGLGGSTARAGGRMIAVDKYTGQKLWQTQVDTHPAAVITSSPVVFGGTVYVGVSSLEEVFATQPGYSCCSFRGSVVALDAATGQLQWKTYTVPTGYAGGAVWGSTPAIDPSAGQLYVATGNNYSAPAGVCITPGQTGCTAPAADDHADSVLALDLRTGSIRWSKGTMSTDVFTLVCGNNPNPNCGPDFDFGSGPNLIQLPSGQKLVGVGQKSGVYWALDPATGAVVWQTQVGPGSSSGGILWGSATDGGRIYAAIGNQFGTSYSITSASGQTSTTSGGSWAALDAATGRILWQVADPQQAADIGYVSVANGVMYAGSTANNGNDMYALDAANGNMLWSFASGGPVKSGAAIVNGTVYWGSGASNATRCTGGTGPMQTCASGNNKMFAFHLPATY